MTIKRFLRLLLICLPLLASCDTENYETGDGKYSYLSASFGEVRTSAPTEVVGAVTDDGESLTFSPHYTAKWAEKGDTLYRALIYYFKRDHQDVEAYSLSPVPVVSPLITERPDTVPNDPLTLESVWVSNNGEYLNVGFAVKTGVQEGLDARQTVGVIQETPTTSAEDSKELYLRVVHGQNGVPEYYTSRSFISVPVSGKQYETIHLSVNTYQGVVTKELRLSN